MAAYTFDEVFANSQPATFQGRPPVIGDEYSQVHIHILITQEDGRFAFGDGWAFVDHLDRMVKLEPDQISQQSGKLHFNDRANFQPPDEVNFRFGNVNASTIRATLTFRSWGNAQSIVECTLPPNFATLGKLHLGWGGTIGHGSGQALHRVTFNEIVRSRIDII